MRRRIRAYLDELPGALLLSLLTATTTIVLALVISIVVGGQNAEHRLASRCFANQTMELIREIVRANENLDAKINLDLYPPISIEGINCEVVFEHLSQDEIDRANIDQTPKP